MSERYAVILLAEKVTPHALDEVTRVLAARRVNVDAIKRLSAGDFGCVEMIVSSPEPVDRDALKRELWAIAGAENIDVALQTEDQYRRAKRLIVFDMDSTLIQCEVVDELARQKGAFDEVAAITREAMEGKIDFDESLKRRCEKLRGLTSEDLELVYDRIQLTPGGEDLIRVLKKLGCKTALISGGFHFVADRLQKTLGIDFVHANRLEIVDGRVSGRVTPPILNARRKAELLEAIAKQEKIPLDQVVAVGDGANDILMLQKAGLGIAFNAKPAVREKADIAITRKNLRSILYLLGSPGRLNPR